MKTNFLYAAKGHVAAVIALVTTLVAAVAPYNAFNETTAVPIIIALTGAFLVWFTPRASYGALAYTKLGIAVLTAVAQVVVPLFYSTGFGWAQVPVVALAIFSAYKVWETEDEKSVVNLAVNNEGPAPQSFAAVASQLATTDTTVNYVPEHAATDTV